MRLLVLLWKEREGRRGVRRLVRRRDRMQEGVEVLVERLIRCLLLWNIAFQLHLLMLVQGVVSGCRL